MSLSKAKYLLDVNVFLALLSENHIHHPLVTAWFNTPDLQWAICPFTETGFLRNATAPRPGQITLSEATAVLARIAQQPGYHYVPITADWQTLCRPFFPRLYGPKQVTHLGHGDIGTFEAGSGGGKVDYFPIGGVIAHIAHRVG